MRPSDPELDRILADCWRRLAAATGDRAAPLRTPVLASTALDGAPDARTVILRRVEPEQARLYVNTDRRSPKHAQLQEAPRAVLVGFDPQAELQLRLYVETRIRRSDEAVQRAWEALSPDGRRLYLTAAAPGQPAAGPTDGVPGEAEEGAGFANFVLIEARLTRLDWLHMGAGGHRRAAFRWTEAGEIEAAWLYP